MSETDLSPLMRQYRDIKRAHAGAILFFRVGDFYEMFYQDAEDASRLLSIALTSRDKSSADPVPLCGVPYHAASGYIAKLLKAGRTVALCEQVEDPKVVKGLIRREVVRLYTPGTLVDAELLPATEACWLAAVTASPVSPGAPQEQQLGLAALDLSTGEFRICEFDGRRAVSHLQDELSRLEPKELLLSADLPPDLSAVAAGLPGCRVCLEEGSRFDEGATHAALHKQFSTHIISRLVSETSPTGRCAAGAVLRYLYDTQPNTDLRHIHEAAVQRFSDTMRLDSMTIRNLELVRPLNDPLDAEASPRTTVLGVLDRTVTVMGSRLMRDWIIRPLVDLPTIQSRLDAVEELAQGLEPRFQIRAALKPVQDIARLTSRIAVVRASPRDVLSLKRSLLALTDLRVPLARLHSPLLRNLVGEWDSGEDLTDLIVRAVHPDAPALVRDGGIIQDGYHCEVDGLRTAMRDGKQWIAQLEARERARTGIESLKVRYNQVFGYYLEITKANLAKVPSDYIRKQTLANAERFMTPELKELEERVTGAEAKLTALEVQLFEQVLQALARHTERLQTMARRVATLDVVATLAEVATLYRYVRPEVHDGTAIHITGGRHAVIERLAQDLSFVPNDTQLDQDTHRLLILTGPNMAGKSTYLRQVALIVLMAQMGSFVPAAQAAIGLVDRIFTRVGASDNLSAGRSTFMVEMSETAHILHHATPRSLILLDEIGRGTSTYDGLSLAWAIAEFIQDTERLGARTLFATHYHEMTQLADRHPSVQNYRVSVQERDGDVLFLRKIVAGGADRSYGIHVGKLAGLPKEIVSRAQDVLRQLEQSSSSSPQFTEPVEQVSFLDPALPAPHPILEEVRQMDLFSMTPLDALNRLADLKRRLE
ncbi:DNA mismatch repair protein MutS [Nitrospira sp.]|nr:DNA mismatch repair protein MutS [Nitrospira sp.]